MSALSGFRDADTLRIDSLTFEVEGLPQLAGHHTPQPSCVGKAPGDVEFVLGARDDMGLYGGAELVAGVENEAGATRYNPEIPLRLVADGPSTLLPGGRVRQGYVIDETTDVDIRHQGVDLHVDRVQGRIVLDLTERIPWIETRSCTNQVRYRRVDVVSDPEASRLDIRGSASGDGTTMRVTSIALAGGAASTGFDIGIHVSRNECGVVGVVPGGTQRFVASVGNLPPGARSYAWSVQGATIVGDANLPHLEVALSAAPEADPAPVQVELRVGVAGLWATVAADFKPDTPVQRRAKELLCEIQRHAFHNVRPNPLWDPIRDRVAQPFTREELIDLRDATATLLHEIEKALHRDG